MYTLKTATPRNSNFLIRNDDPSKRREFQEQFEKSIMTMLCSFWNAIYSGGVSGIKVFTLLCGGWHSWKFNFIFNNLSPGIAWNTGVSSQGAWTWCLLTWLRTASLNSQVKTLKLIKRRCSEQTYPGDTLLLMPARWERVTLPGRRDFEDVIQVRIWRWGDCSRLSGRTQCNHRSLIRRR